jgi:uncharacterized protein (TIGR03118 family)
LKLARTLMPIALCAVAASAWAAPPTQYQVTNLTSDLSGATPNVDPILQNAWGIAFTTGGSPFWIADNATGCSTLYDGAGVPQPTTTPKPLRVKIPLPGGSIPSTACMHATSSTSPTPAAPTGLVFNSTPAFLVPKQSTNIPALFIFDTEDGTISAWAGGLNPSDQAVLAVDESADKAVFKALAFGTNSHGTFLFATNFRLATVEAFAPNGSTGYRRATSSEVEGDFTDSNIPPGYAPFGIHTIGGVLFVTYALQNAEKHDDVAGQGHGFVDIFGTDGHLIQRFAQHGQLNSPWGVVRASMSFGDFSGLILVGNFGDGTINAYDNNGRFVGTVRGLNNKPVVINGLWSLTLGGALNSNPATLYFTAGPNGETDGLFGTVTPIP